MKPWAFSISLRFISAMIDDKFIHSLNCIHIIMLNLDLELISIDLNSSNQLVRLAIIIWKYLIQVRHESISIIINFTLITIRKENNSENAYKSAVTFKNMQIMKVVMVTISTKECKCSLCLIVLWWYLP